MKTMRGCDFCSKHSSGGIVVCCSSCVCSVRHNSPSPIPQMAYCSSDPDFPTKPRQINTCQQQERKLNLSVTIHGFCGENPVPGRRHCWAWRVFVLVGLYLGCRDAGEEAQCGDKPAPESIEMGCDKIYSAFLLQQVLKCLQKIKFLLQQWSMLPFPPINTPNPDKNSPVLVSLSNPPPIFIIIIFNQK